MAGVHKRFVEIGRVCRIVNGTNKGKLCVIVDVLDQNRALIDGPCSGVQRGLENFKDLHLSSLVIPKLQKSARTRTVRKAWEENSVDEQWNNSIWAKKIVARERRAALTDFERFKVRKAKQMRNRIINVAYGKIRKAEKKNKK